MADCAWRLRTGHLQQFEVEPAETLGRLVYDLGDGQWNIAGLRRLLEEVLSEDGTVVDYRVEHEFESIGERVMLVNGNRMRRENTTDTILLAITDITERERLRFELEGQKEFAEKLIDSVRELLVVLGWDLRVHFANESFYTRFAVTREETEGRLIYELGNRQWDIPRLRLFLEQILPKDNSFDDYEMEHEFESIGKRTMLLNGRRLDHMNSCAPRHSRHHRTAQAGVPTAHLNGRASAPRKEHPQPCACAGHPDAKAQPRPGRLFCSL